MLGSRELPVVHTLGELFPRHGAGLPGLWRPPIDSALGDLSAAEESAARSNLELNTDVSNVERAVDLQRDFASWHDKTLSIPTRRDLLRAPPPIEISEVRLGLRGQLIPLDRPGQLDCRFDLL